MHDGVLYDPMQGQGLLKFPKLHFSKSVSCTTYNGSWQMTTNSYTTAQYLNLIWLDF